MPITIPVSAGIEATNNVSVVQLGGMLGFTLEAGQERFMLPPLGAQYLHGIALVGL